MTASDRQPSGDGPEGEKPAGADWPWAFPPDRRKRGPGLPARLLARLRDLARGHRPVPEAPEPAGPPGPPDVPAPRPAEAGTISASWTTSLDIPPQRARPYYQEQPSVPEQRGRHRYEN